MRVTVASRILISIALCAAIALSWTSSLDIAASDATTEKFKRALAVAAIARGFNGVISVAQGTEVAIQPVGVGVTLTLGEILDPLNDLVERFSLLALMASIALGAQLTLGEMASTFLLSALTTLAVCAYLVALWWPSRQVQSESPAAIFTTRWGWVARLMSVFVFARFLIAVIMLVGAWVDDHFLAERQALATQALQETAVQVAELEQAPQINPNPNEMDFLDRTSAQLQNWFDNSKQTLDIEAQLAALEAKLEESVEQMIRLIVIFLIQTLLLPMASLWLAWLALKAFWRWTANPQ